MTEPDDIRGRIDNTLAIIGAQPLSDLAGARRQISMLVETLRAARTAIGDLDEQLDLVTAPERGAAARAQELERELAAAQGRIAELQASRDRQQLDAEIEGALRREERKRLADLERRAKDFDEVLRTDPEAFGRFMDKALDDGERKKRR